MRRILTLTVALLAVGAVAPSLASAANCHGDATSGLATYGLQPSTIGSHGGTSATAEPGVPSRPGVQFQRT